MMTSSASHQVLLSMGFLSASGMSHWRRRCDWHLQKLKSSARGAPVLCAELHRDHGSLGSGGLHHLRFIQAHTPPAQPRQRRGHHLLAGHSAVRLAYCRKMFCSMLLCCLCAISALSGHARHQRSRVSGVGSTCSEPASALALWPEHYHNIDCSMLLCQQCVKNQLQLQLTAV